MTLYYTLVGPVASILHPSSSPPHFTILSPPTCPEYPIHIYQQSCLPSSTLRFPAPLSVAFMAMTLTFAITGLRTPGAGDEYFWNAHRPSAVHNEAQALHLHLRQSYNSQVSVWHEGGHVENRLYYDMLMWRRLHSFSSWFFSLIASTVSGVCRPSWPKPRVATRMSSLHFIHLLY